MNLWGQLSFTTPALLAGLALLALPVVAHLLNRRTRRVIVFPTLRFLQKTAGSQSRLFRMRRWILLALRCLLVALAVAAFARPLWIDRSATAAMQPGSEALVVLIDNSASTQQQLDGVPLAYRLRTEAIARLSALPAGGLAGVVVVDGRPWAVYPKLSRNLPGLKEELQQLPATLDRAAWSEALSAAAELLASHPGPVRLVILSDLQATNWDDFPTPAAAGALLPKARWEFWRPESPVPRNLALSQPRIAPRSVPVGQPSQWIVQAANFSDQPAQEQVVCRIAGQSAQSTLIRLGPGEVREVSFTLAATPAGQLQAQFELPADALTADNRCYLAASATKAQSVLLVSDEDAQERGTAAFYLQRALAPNGSAADRFTVQVVGSRNLPADFLATHDAVLLAYAGELPPDTAKHLMTYVEQGGALWVLCGPGPVPRNLRLLAEAATRPDPLPWQPAALERVLTAEEPLQLAAGRWRSPLLSDFAAAGQLALGQVALHRVWQTGPLHPEAEVLLSYSDGSPALAVRAVGTGRLAVANFSPDAVWSDLGRHGTFVALVQSLAGQLRPVDTQARQFLIGQPARFDAALDPLQRDQLEVVAPSAEPVSYEPLALAHVLTVELSDPQEVGFYRLRSTAEESQTLATLAVNIDPRESDLRNLPLVEVQGKWSSLLTSAADQGTQPASTSSPVSPAAGQTPGAAKSRQSARQPADGGQPLWSWCLLGVMVVAAVELLCLGIWRR